MNFDSFKFLIARRKIDETDNEGEHLNNNIKRQYSLRLEMHRHGSPLFLVILS